METLSGVRHSTATTCLLTISGAVESRASECLSLRNRAKRTELAASDAEAAKTMDPAEPRVNAMTLTLKTRF